MDINEFLLQNKDINKLLMIFIDEFKTSYKKLKRNQISKKQAIIKNSQIIFMKWYFSTLIDNTYFSPANILNRIVYENFGDDFAVIPYITPIFIENELRDFNFRFNVFSLNQNPLLDDLKKALSTLKDKKIEVNSEKMAEVIEAIRSELPNCENLYAYHLFILAEYFSLIQIYKNGNNLHFNVNDFDIDALKKKNSYKEIINCFAINTEANLEFILNELNPFNKTYLKRNIKNKVVLEEFGEKLFKTLNIDVTMVRELMFLNQEGFLDATSDYFAAMVILSKYFIFPLSYCIPIIQPCFFDRFDFDEMFKDLFEANGNDLLLDEIIYSPFMVYDLTYFGDKIMNRAKKDKFQDVFDTKVDVDEIIKTRNEINNNPQLYDFWRNIDLKELEEFFEIFQQEEKEKESKKDFYKEGNVIHLFKKEK